MPRTYKLISMVCLCLATIPACFVRRRAVQAATTQTRPLLTATKEELVQRVHGVWDPLQSFIMRADLSPSVLDPSKGAATDYATVGVNILFRKPDQIRILGQDPVLSSTIFDMVSDGKEFRVSIPRRKRFIVGNINAPGTSQNKLENLRPGALLTSLVIYPPDPTTDFTALENDPEGAVYMLLIVRREADQFIVARNIYFDRHTLQIIRQKSFDSSGDIVSDAKYSDWKSYGGVPFPSDIDIQRPKDNYEVELNLVNIRINTPDVTADKFILAQPQDTQLEELK